MNNHDSVNVQSFQGALPGEVFRRAADWLNGDDRQRSFADGALVIRGVDYSHIDRAYDGTEVLSIFFTEGSVTSTEPG